MLVDRFLSLLWILVGAASAWIAIDLGLTGAAGPDSGFFPLLAASIICVGGIVLFATQGEGERVEWPSREGWLRLTGVVAGLALMALLITRVGFVASGLVSMLVLLKLVERARWTEALVLSIASVAAVVVIFGKLLGMPLPLGPWGF